MPNPESQSPSGVDQAARHERAEPIQNTKSKIQNGKRPYVATPARRAAARANLQKARAAGKEKIYRPTPKRLAANRANLAKAHAARRQALEQTVHHLHQAFPPLRKEVQPPAGSEADTDLGQPHPCREEVEKSNGEGSLDASTFNSSTSSSQNPKPEIPNGGPVRGSRWVCDWPRGASPGRESADYPALEKAGRAILHRRRAVLREARREAQRVMRLLTEAAQRTVAASLSDMLALASGLIAVLAHSRLCERAQRLNRRTKRHLGAFLDQRYGEKALPWMAEQGPNSRRRLRFKPRPQPQPVDALGQEGSPPAGAPAPEAAPPLGTVERSADSGEQGAARPPAGASGPPAGPDLPPTLEVFQALVRRAFCAPNPEPEEETLGLVLDGLAETLWERLHLFEAALQKEAKELQDTFGRMGQRPPNDAEDVVDRCYGIENLLGATIDLDLEELLATYLRQIRQDAGLVIEERYGPSPEIERFCRASD